HTYKDAGVDIDAGEALVERIKPLAKLATRREVVADVGGFAGLCAIPAGYREPLLVSGTDGVGTKLKSAFATGRHDTVGIDLVAMSVNDILVQGAEPLFFLDYFVCERLDVDVAAKVIEGIAKGCEMAGCALIGGETAEHPGTFPKGEYDLAGFAVGVVEKSAIIDGRGIAPGDRLIGLASSGPHSNGYSLVRKIIAVANADLHAPIAGPAATGDAPAASTPAPRLRPLGDALLAPTRIYVKPVLALAARLPVKGMAHITGGGLVENVPRILADGLQARLERAKWPRPAVFDWLQEHGNVSDAEMHRVFNCGIGMVIAMAPADAGAAIAMLNDAGERAFDIGEVVARPEGEAAAIVV
ncbi:MAG TPA: phosphoribosylformylglycinamidine cyclo-ligase, partial [Ideonella sp.]|nr:phosphoribosylformylglycinamidine cyclo-ligase [Ideonella sp.]